MAHELKLKFRKFKENRVNTQKTFTCLLKEQDSSDYELGYEPLASCLPAPYLVVLFSRKIIIVSLFKLREG